MESLKLDLNMVTFLNRTTGAVLWLSSPVQGRKAMKRDELGVFFSKRGCFSKRERQT